MNADENGVCDVTLGANESAAKSQGCKNKVNMLRQRSLVNR